MVRLEKYKATLLVLFLELELILYFHKFGIRQF